ncbi:MAG: beta-N-acetylhexosaminidase [Clostridia bacterium]|nr:beta-N-acetylhexosaminidase [Clostridia bacterium]
MVKLNFINIEKELEGAVAELASKMDFCEAKDGLNIAVSKRRTDGITVKKDRTGYAVEYGTIPDFCRGLCILLDRMEKQEESFCVSEDRKIKKCGIMADVSRNAVMRVETAKDLISRIARMGMNTFMLYMEDVYKVEGYPYFGYMRGAYTEDEMRAIDEYASGFGVEVVPCIQTLAHLASTLRWPYAEGMRDTADVLLVGAEKTYDFIEAMISTVSRCFSSKRIHVGMDEAWGLGTGVYKSLNGQVDKFEIISAHLKRVVEILKKYGKEPMMWSDMLFRIASKKGGYFDTEAVMPENILELIPKDVTMAYWDYYNEIPEVYHKMLAIHKTMERNVAFFGGIWTWNGIGVNYDKTFRTTIPAMEACRKHGIDEICATLWRDDGGETDIYTALLGMQFFGEYIYYEKVDMAHLSDMFRICTGCEAEDFLLFDLDNLPESVEYKKTLTDIEGVVTAAKHTLYQDVLQGLFDEQYKDVDLKGHYLGIYNGLCKASVHEDLRELFEYHKQLAKVLYLKSDIGLRITENYKNHNKVGLRENISELSDLGDEAGLLHQRLSELWLKNNKAFGLDRIDLRFGGLIARINRGRMRLEDYMDGKIQAVEELEEEKLCFSTAKFPAYRSYNSFISASIG